MAWPASGTANLAVFGGTTGNVTVDAALAANALQFGTSGYVLSGAQTLTLNGTTPSLDVAGASSTATIGNNTTLTLTGTAGVSKTGTGTLTLNSSAAHTFTGGLRVNSGTLVLSLANLATPTDLVPATNTLSVGAGTFTVTGKVGAASSQTFANTILNKGNAQIRVGPPTGGAATTLNLGVVSRSTPGSTVRYNTAAGGFGTAASTTERLFVGGTTNGTWFAPWAFTGDHTTTSLRWAYTDTTTGQIRQQAGITATATTMANVTGATSVYTASGTFTPPASITALGLQSNGSTTYNLNGVSASIGGFINIPANTAANFNTTGGGTIQINSGKELFTAGIGTTNINVPIVDNPGNASHLTHLGGGNLVLGAVNTYTGETNVIGGTMIVSETGTINTSSGVYILPGGTFRQNNFSTPLSAPVTLIGGKMEGYGNAGTVTVSNSTSNILANLTTSPAPLTIDNLVFQGTGTLAPKLGTTLVNGNPVTNLPFAVNTLTTNPSAGKVVIAPISPTGGWADGSTTYDVLTVTTLNGSISDFVVGTASPAFAARQAATLFMEGNTLKITVAGDKALWTGAANGNWTTTAVGTPFNWRTQTGGQNTEFISNDEVVFDDTATNTNVVISDANVATANIYINNATKDYSITGAAGLGISSVGSFIKTGAGSLTLGGTNTYTGTTTITEGKLVVGSSTAFQGTNSVQLGTTTATTTANATFDLNGFNAKLISLTTASPAAPATPIVSTITNGASGTGTDTLTIVTPTAAISALVTDGLTRKTAISVGGSNGNLTNPNNTFSGGYQMLGASNGGAVGGVRLSPSAANNPTIVDGVLTKGTYGTGTITMGGDATDKSQFYFNTANVVIANRVVVNTANGTDTIGAFRAEDYGLVVSGTVVANKASVVVNHNGQFSGGPTAGAPAEVTGGQLTFTGPIIAGENAAAGLTASQTNLSTTKRLIVTLANATATPNSYTGPTTIGTANVWLRLGAANQIPDGAGRGNVVMSGGTFDLNDFSETINGLSGSGFVENINGVSPVTLTLGAGDATGTNFSGILFDARGGAKLSLTKIGTGTQILSGGNQYTGNTTINAGTLQLGNGSTTGALLPSSQIVNNGTFAINRSNAVTQGTDFAAGISGTGGLSKSGTGTLVLNSANTYAGSTAINAGTLSLTDVGTVGSGPVSLATGATFDVSGSSAATISLPGGLGGSGTVTATGKTLSIGGSFSPVSLAITGNVSLTSGAATTLVAGDSPATTSQATVTGTVVNRGALAITAAPSVTFANGQSYTFFAASGGITSGFTSVSVGSLALTAGSAGVWTGTSNGLTYTYTESSGSLAVATAAPQLTALQSWRQQFFGSPESTGNGADNADPDNDGLSNLMEYALGTDPTISGASPVVVGKSGNFLTLTYPRRSPSDPALTYTVQGSADLVAGFTTATGSTTNSGSTYTYTDNVDLSSAGIRRFLRLSVTYTPAP